MIGTVLAQSQAIDMSDQSSVDARAVRPVRPGISRRGIVQASMLCLAAILTGGLPSTFAQATDCDTGEVEVSLTRMGNVDGNPGSDFFVQDYLTVRPCRDTFRGRSWRELDQLLADHYVLGKCMVVRFGEKAATCITDSGRGLILASDIRSHCVGNRCYVEFFEAPAKEAPQSKPERGDIWTFQGAAGNVPFGWMLGHWGKAGHYEITEAALRAFATSAGITPSGKSLDLAASASQDPDFFDWETPAAHGQTTNDRQSGKLTNSSAQAQTDFGVWVNEKLAKAKSECKAGRPQTFLYLLGYGLHATQDAVFHEGMSNAEHSYRDQERTRVDTDFMYDQKMTVAREATLQVLQKVHQTAMTNDGKSCLAVALATPSGNSAGLDRKAKLGLVGRPGRDLTLRSYEEFRDLSAIVKTAISCADCEQAYFLQNKWLGWDNHSSTAQALEEALKRIKALLETVLQ